MPQVPMNDQFYMGRGVNISTGKVFRVAIEYDEPQSVTTGQQTILTLESITSSYELSEKLSISVSASASAGVWSGSAGFKLMRQREVNNYYTYALVKVEVRNPALTLRNPRLTQEAEKKLKEDGWDAFVALYGYEYIEGYISGGTYYAMIEFQTKTESEQQDVRVKLSGSYGSFSVSGSIEASFREVSKTTSHNVFVIQSGGSGDIIEIKLEDMIKQAVAFPQLVKESPVPVFAQIVDYKSTVNLPNIPAPDSLLRIRQKDTLDELGKRYLKLRDYKSSLQFVLDNLVEFDEFRDFSAEQISKKREEFEKSLEDTANDLDMIVRRSTRCTDDATQCETYVPTATILPLPTIGGKLMTIKQLEERVTNLQTSLDKLLEASGTHATHQEVGQVAAQLGQVKQQADSIQNIINGKSTVDGGYVQKNYLAISHPIANGENVRTDTIHVAFAPGRFSVTPSVVMMLNSFEMAGNSTVNVFPRNITPAGFDCAIEVWASTHLHAVSAAWIAYTPR